ncbi:MAG: response regulator [Anaerolineales bacterium]|jgi:CheY-like chemotaxis protein
MSKILIVDDDLGMVRLLTTLFELDGHSVVGISERESILPTASAERPDLVILDVFLGGEDSLELIGQMKQTPELSEIPIIVTSGMELSEKCKAAGCDAFILKPFTPDQLTAAIDEHLGGRGEKA